MSTFTDNTELSEEQVIKTREPTVVLHKSNQNSYVLKSWLALYVLTSMLGAIMLANEYKTL